MKFRGLRQPIKNAFYVLPIVVPFNLEDCVLFSFGIVLEIIPDRENYSFASYILEKGIILITRY